LNIFDSTVSPANAAGFYDATERAWRKDAQNGRIFVGNQLFFARSLEQTTDTKELGVICLKNASGKKI
jgi:hypothetical protein